MLFSLRIFFLALLIQLVGAAEIGLLVQPFAFSQSSNLNNAKLSWSLLPGVSSYSIERKGSTGQYAEVATVGGNSYDDYSLAAGAYSYRVLGGSTTSNEQPVDIPTPPPACTVYDNTAVSHFTLKSDIKSGGTYYQYNIHSGSTGFANLTVATSSDGYTFSGSTVVLTSSAVCVGTTDDGCKLESVSFSQHPTTGEVVMWAHWEYHNGYVAARVAVAHGKPGAQMTFGGSFRPLGSDSRDISFFADDDASAYILSATNDNSDLAIYELTSNWHNISSRVATVLQNQHREAPSLVHDSGNYFLFTSLAAGWYPSEGTYITAKNVSGPWSEQRDAGNIATFGAQSGGVSRIANGDRYMGANRWAAEWKNPEPANRVIALPAAFSTTRYANYAFYPKVCYNEGAGKIWGVQDGKIVSVGKSVTASVDAKNATIAVDGVYTDADAVWTPSSVPFWLEVDLGQDMTVRRVELTTKLIGGSEHYYAFTVTGTPSNGGNNVTLVDESQNTVVGFVTSPVSSSVGKVRKVRLNVSKVVNVQNGHADNSTGVAEFLIYAD